MIYHDNLRAMTLTQKEDQLLIEVGILTSFLLRQRVDAGKAVIRHLGTVSMSASILKTLQGAQLKTGRAGLRGNRR